MQIPSLDAEWTRVGQSFWEKSVLTLSQLVFICKTSSIQGSDAKCLQSGAVHTVTLNIFAEWWSASYQWHALKLILAEHVQVALVLIDEVHLLNESRGAALEAGVVSRIKMIGALHSMSEVCLLSNWTNARARYAMCTYWVFASFFKAHVQCHD